MKIAFFDTHQFEKNLFQALAEKAGHSIHFFDHRLTAQTALSARGSDCVCAFVNDRLDEPTLRTLAQEKVRLIALRSAGFNHVNLKVAQELKMTVVRVPEYSPYAVAEHAVALLLALNRKIHKAYNRVREGNFSLEGLTGFDLHQKTVGVIGTGRIGTAFVNIMLGFGCRVLAFDKAPNSNLAEKGVKYVSLLELLKASDVVSLHIPLNDQTRHMIAANEFAAMKPNALLINTSRGALVETKALIQALKKSKIAGAGLDVYEEEEGVFFEDLSGTVLQDDTLARLLTFPNVLLTSHQGFLTQEALMNIAQTTIENISQFERGGVLSNQV